MYPVSPVIPIADNPELIIAEHQKEYLPLPSIKAQDGTILTRWKLTEEECAKVVEQGYIYLELLCVNQSLPAGMIQPMRLGADIPDGFELKPLEDWADEIRL